MKRIFIIGVITLYITCEALCILIKKAEEVTIANLNKTYQFVPYQEEKKEIKEVVTNKVNMTAHEREYLARLLYTEARGESVECQKAVVSVVLNRVRLYNSDIMSIITAKGQFDLGNKLGNIKPLQTQYDVVDDIILNDTTLPSDVLYFRSGHAHVWAEYYTTIGNMYFSR